MGTEGIHSLTFSVARTSSRVAGMRGILAVYFSEPSSRGSGPGPPVPGGLLRVLLRALLRLLLRAVLRASCFVLRALLRALLRRTSASPLRF